MYKNETDIAPQRLSEIGNKNMHGNERTGTLILYINSAKTVTK